MAPQYPDRLQQRDRVQAAAEGLAALNPHSVLGWREGVGAALADTVPSHGPHCGRQLPGPQYMDVKPQKPERLWGGGDKGEGWGGGWGV